MSAPLPLLPGEELLLRAKRHWIAFLAPLLIGFLGLYLRGVLPEVSRYLIYTGLGYGIAVLLRHLTTSVVVTDRRVLLQQGIVRRKTARIAIGEIESTGVEQSLVGRLFGYGSLSIKGTGDPWATIRGLDEAPFVDAAIHEAKDRSGDSPLLPRDANGSPAISATDHHQLLARVRGMEDMLEVMIRRVRRLEGIARGELVTLSQPYEEAEIVVEPPSTSPALPAGSAGSPTALGGVSPPE